MKLPRSINRTLYLVRIDKAKQLAKREKFNDWLYANPNNVFMTRNQQHGEIVLIGSSNYPAPMRYDNNGHELGEDWSAQEWLPDARPGDTLLFHHSIEGTMDDRGGNDERQEFERTKYILFEDETYRYYWVPRQQAYAVVKSDGSIITTPDWVLCEPHEKEKKQEDAPPEERKVVESPGGILLLENYTESESEKQQRLQRLQQETKWLSKTGTANDPNKEREIKESIQRTMNEMASITGGMTKKRALPFMFLHGSKQFNQDCGVPIDRSYIIYYNSISDSAPTIEFNGREYALIKVSQILYLQKVA